MLPVSQIVSLIALSLLTIGLFGWLVTIIMSWARPERAWLPVVFASVVGITSPVLATLHSPPQFIPVILIALIVLISWGTYRAMWLRVGYRLLREGRFDEAVPVLKQAIERLRLSKARAKAYLGLCTALSRKDEHAAAIECAIKAVQTTRDPDILCVAHATLCALYWSCRDLENCIKHGEAALATKSSYLEKFKEVTMFLSLAYAEKGMVEKTQDMTKSMSQASRGLAVGLAYLRSGKPRDAISIWEEALRDPQSKPYECNLRVNLAVALASIGEFDRCIMESRKVLELGPTEKGLLGMAYNNLAYAFTLKNENLDEAERLIRKALDLRIDSLRGVFNGTLGMVLMRKGDYQNAVEALRSSIEHQSNTSVRGHDTTELLHLYLGQAYMALGQTDNARTAFRKVIELDKHGASAKHARELLSKLP